MRACAEQACERRDAPLEQILLAGHGQQRTEPIGQLGAHLGGSVAFGDAASGTKHLRQRPVDHTLPERQTTPAQQPHRSLAQPQPPLELVQQARLAHPRLPHDRDQLRSALTGRTLEQTLQTGELLLAPHQRGVGTTRARCVLGGRAHLHGLPRRDGLGLALELQRREPEVVHLRRGQASRPVTDEDAADLRRRLQASGYVHGVAQDRVCLADPAGQHLTGVHPHPQRELHAELGLDPAVQLRHRRLHTEGRSHRPLSVVLVGDRRAEHRHHRVADELVDTPAETLDLACQPIQARLQQRLDRLVVQLLGHGGVARDVREHHRDRAPLLVL